MNIVYMMADQWRWDTIFQEGHICRTPNLRRLAEQSQVFHNAYTCCPLCTPARGSLFTGNWPYQNCLTDNVGGNSFYPHGKLHLGYRTYLERLRDDAGYEIAYCGKWHLGAGTLHERGIDNVRGSDGGDIRHGSGGGRYPSPKLE
jgi:arylsulfatase A-like enzyme